MWFMKLERRLGGHMKKSNLIPKQKYIRRRTVEKKKTESIMECIQITPAGGVFFCGGNLEKLTNEEIEEELRKHEQRNPF